MFFDRIAGGDLLATIARILTVLVGTLLIISSIGLFVAAWKGRSVTSMDANSVKGKLMVDACCAAPSALVFGFCLVRTIQYFDSLSFIATILFGACLVADLVYTRYEVRRLAANVIAKEAATQFLCSCVFFGMLSFCLGMALSGWNWFSTGFMRAFNLLFWSAMTGIGIYPVFRNAKRLTGAVGPRQ